jgi:hypothetical protein
MSDFTLEIEFDGLCVFVPNARCNEMTVLLVNALGSAVPTMSGHMYQVPPHYPFLSFDLAQQVPPRYYDIGFPGDLAALFFRWEDLEILPGGNPLPGNEVDILPGRRPDTSEPSGPNEDRDFSWVPQLDKILPAGAKILPAVLYDNPPRNLVMGRVDLTSGEIGTEVVVKSGGRNVIFEFRCQKSGNCVDYCQALASRIRYSLEIEDEDFVELRFTRFGDRALGEQARRSIKLAPGDRPTVEVDIRNLTLEEMLGLPPRSTGGVQQDHFTQLYSVLTGLPDDLPIPQPLYAPDLQGGPAHAADTLCLAGSVR